jgi:hypothetical protein
MPRARTERARGGPFPPHAGVIRVSERIGALRGPLPRGMRGSSERPENAGFRAATSDALGRSDFASKAVCW